MKSTEKTLKRYLVVSILVHVMILRVMMGGGAGDGKGKGKGQFEQAERRDIIEIEPVVEEIPQEQAVTVGDPLEAKRKQLKKQRKDCKPFFGGIGVTLDPSTGTITKAYLGYPAEEHGVLTGDVLLTNDVIGEVGTEVVVRIKRGKEVLEIAMTRGRICVKDLDPRTETP